MTTFSPPPGLLAHPPQGDVLEVWTNLLRWVSSVPQCPCVPLGRRTNRWGLLVKVTLPRGPRGPRLMLECERVRWAITCNNRGLLAPLENLNLPHITLQVLRRPSGLHTGTSEKLLQKWSLRLPREERTSGLLVVIMTRLFPMLATVEPTK